VSKTAVLLNTKSKSVYILNIYLIFVHESVFTVLVSSHLSTIFNIVTFDWLDIGVSVCVCVHGNEVLPCQYLDTVTRCYVVIPR